MARRQRVDPFTPEAVRLLCRTNALDGFRPLCPVPAGDTNLHRHAGVRRGA
jgi:hypothetical protein